MCATGAHAATVGVDVTVGVGVGDVVRVGVTVVAIEREQHSTIAIVARRILTNVMSMNSHAH